jgi:hypothetical protein
LLPTLITTKFLKMNKRFNTRWMKLLGYTGLIPFIGFALLSMAYKGTDLSTMFGQWNLLYGACIVSFLGAIHWGIVLAQSSPDRPCDLAGHSGSKQETLSLIWGVTPSLIAWLIMALSPADWSLWLMGGSLWLIWLVDQKALRPLKTFDDYLRLRTHLTFGASVGLFLTAATALMV